eukprot:15255114-Alexandrium_andersonii.AAC.1
MESALEDMERGRPGTRSWSAARGQRAARRPRRTRGRRTPWGGPGTCGLRSARSGRRPRGRTADEADLEF